ncbi:MAG: hypothetical protein AAF502_06445 [Bacteroidota bacterium]
MTKLKSLSTVLALLMFVSVFASCTKEDIKAFTDEEAVVLIESSMQKSTGGMEETTAKYSENLVNEIAVNEACDEDHASSYPFSYSNALITADYVFDWAYMLSCNNLNIPTSADFTASSDGNYTTKRLTSNDNSSTAFIVTGLQPSVSSLTMNGVYTRNGTQVLTTNFNTRNISSALMIDLTDLEVAKSDFEIESGTGTILLTVTAEGNVFTFEGEIVFLGDSNAALTLNGVTYDINLG